MKITFMVSGDMSFQLSAQFELAGLTSLLHLGQMTSDMLIGMTGIKDIAAQRLLQFIHEDIGEIWANKSLHPKQVRYSYW